MPEPTYDALRARHEGSEAASSVQKMQNQNDDVLASGLIERQMSDLKMAIDDSDQIITELYNKFAPVLGEELTERSKDLSEPVAGSLNSEHLGRLNNLESIVLSQHRRLRTLLERCEL